jgi:hypothetical protein
MFMYNSQCLPLAVRAGVNVTKDVARQAALPNNLAITEYAYVSVAIYRSLKANTGAVEVPVVGKHIICARTMSKWHPSVVY